MRTAPLCASLLALAWATPALAQTSAGSPAKSGDAYDQDVVVTAQRSSQRLQDVPIAISAFSSESLDKQQIKNSSDLQLTLPNVTFTKTNFTGASFTIRGIGDLCVGGSCDAATAIHVNGTPLLNTRIFETEFFDLDRIEVLRGPQGTLFGRNATSGVVNLITARPDLSKFGATGEAEYGNYNSVKVKGMVNIPLGDTLAVRVAGFYLNRDGYTKNFYNNTRIDGRDMYSVRGSIRWQPSSDTTIDVMGSYFRERDDRLRSQKQLCQRDPTGVLGCLNLRRDNDRTNFNSNLAGTVVAREFLPIVVGSAALAPLAQSLGLSSVYGPDLFSGSPQLTDPREVATPYQPQYFAREIIAQARIEQRFGKIKAQLTGFYHETAVDSRQDFNLGVANRSIYQAAINNLATYATTGAPGFPGSQAYFAPLAAALIPGGANGVLCTSNPNPNNLGAFGGDKTCASVPLLFDRSTQTTRDYSVEGIITTDFDGPINFLLGGIYVNTKSTDVDLYVNQFGLDYTSGVRGSLSSYFAAPTGTTPPSFLGPSQFRSNTPEFRLRSYGIFGEAYVNFNDKIKLTLGLRYNNDRKSVVARSTLLNFLVPYGQTGNAFNSPNAATFDADPLTAGAQPYSNQNATFDAVTGRAVLDYKIDDNHLLYASYSRGYKSGGFNPPSQSVLIAPTFKPEQVDAFEIGSKNVFGGGQLTLNLTAFYYKYKGLQLSRLVNRTSTNDNIDAIIYGAEAEALVRPGPGWTFNFGASYLKTRVTDNKLFINQRDPSGGDPNSVIIKDVSAANCVVRGPTAAAAQGFVSSANAFLNSRFGMTAANGLQGPQPFPTDANVGAATGAFSVCSVLTSLTASPAFNPTGLISVVDGVGVSLRGNQLPQAPMFKFSAGVQKEFNLGNGMKLTPRADLTYTGESYGNVFNGNVNRIQGYEQVNAQIQLDGPSKRWYLRGFVQNLFNNNAVTGLYLGDASTGLITNVFTLEPRRYGVAAGFKF